MIDENGYDDDADDELDLDDNSKTFGDRPSPDWIPCRLCFVPDRPINLYDGICRECAWLVDATDFDFSHLEEQVNKIP